MEMKSGLLLLFLGMNTLCDLKFRKILLWTIGIFFILGLCCQFLLGQEALWSVLPGVLPGSLMLGIGKMTNEAIGYGDGLVVLVTGIYLGVWMTCEIVMIALFLSALWAIVQMGVRKKCKNYEFPWIPFLLIVYVGRMV